MQFLTPLVRSSKTQLKSDQKRERMKNCFLNYMYIEFVLTANMMMLVTERRKGEKSPPPFLFLIHLSTINQL